MLVRCLGCRFLDRAGQVMESVLSSTATEEKMMRRVEVVFYVGDDTSKDSIEYRVWVGP